MGSNQKYIELAKQARAGDKEAMNRLAETVREPLRIYVSRLTLDYDLAQDIVQETLLEMFRFLDKLEKIDRFWPWLLRIATSKVKDHYGRQRGNKIPLSNISNLQSQDRQHALKSLIGRELEQVISSAMSALKPRHRTVLTLRCYEELAYSQIAEVMECSEFGARMLFFRAKKALARQLSCRGLSKGSLLLALALFGKMTAPSKAAAAQISVTAATTKVGVMAAVAATCTGKAAVVSVTAAGLLAAGSMMARPPSSSVATPADKRAKAAHVTDRTRTSGEEYWYYYPSSVNGPMMMRVMKGDSKSKDFHCRYMQDETGNYYYDKRRNTIYINNYRLLHHDLSVWRLPTDPAELREFVSEVEGRSEEMGYVSSNKDGLMVVATLKSGESRLWTTHHYHVLDEEYFRYNWPAGVKLVDQRDTMHKRGWTYFTITGRVNDKQVEGRGRIPFVYATSKTHSPWLILKVGESNVNEVSFAGLGRPWMGLHSLDTIRRDAARQRIRFETKRTPVESQVEVVLKCRKGKLIYTIDMDRDVVERIKFSTNDGRGGELRFSYLQEINQAASGFVEPGRKSFGGRPGAIWLLKLAGCKMGHEE